MNITNKRSLTVQEHDNWRKIHFPAVNDIDEIDEFLDEEIQVDPYVTGTNNRRSDKELAKMLDLIDNLPISTNGKDGTHNG
jgi:hypothetical protein